MITVLEQTELVERLKTLSELEWESLIEELEPHITKTELNHVFDELSGGSDLKDQIQSLEDDVEKLENKIEKYKEILDDISDKANSI
jgi:hypothetical protein